MTALVGALVGILLLGGCGGGGSSTAQTAASAPGTDSGPAPKLRIAEFADGGEIPAANTCDGQGTPPTLRISGVPKGTAELAVLLRDPDAPGGDYFHWGVAGIDPATRELGPQGLPAGAVSSTNDTGDTGYAPPCPPEGDGPHRYEFTLYALSGPSGLEAGADPDTTVAAVEGAASGAVTVTGTYGR